MTDMPPPLLIEARDLCRSHRQGGQAVPALRHVHLRVQAGEFLALAGPSGSGKTSLLNLLGALDRPSSGELRLDGQDLGQLSRTALAALRLHKLGFVFQHYSLIPVLSALENVEYVLVLQGLPAGERRRRAAEALAAVGLGGLLDRRPDQLSGGQQQRVAVARAIVGRPALVLADEPTANLDSDTGDGLLALMRELNQRTGTSFVIATHDSRVMQCASRLVRLKDGAIVEDSAHALPEASPA